MKQFLVTLSDAIKNGILRIFPNASSVRATYIRVVRKGYLSIQNIIKALKVRHISILALLLLLLLLVGCGTSKQIAVVDRVSTDTVYLNKVQYDSIYQNDSFLMDFRRDKRWDNLMSLDSGLPHPSSLTPHLIVVDTMYIRDRKVEYKYKYLRDTTYIHQVDSIPVIQEVQVIQQVKFTPWYAKAFAWLGVILLLALIIRIAIKLYFR